MTESGPGGPPRRAIPESLGAVAPAAAPVGASSDGLEWLRRLDWRQFEQLIATAYRLQGYDVVPTAEGADGGIDLVVSRGHERVFVQCKHWKAWQVGAPTIRELFGVVVANGATGGVVVTSGTFSQEARLFAEQVGIILLDGPVVLQLVAAGRITTSPAPSAASPPSPGVPSGPPPAVASAPERVLGTAAVPACPICLSPMVLRRARRGRHAGSRFWGCSRFPGCRGVRPASPSVGPSPAMSGGSGVARGNRGARVLLAVVSTIGVVAIWILLVSLVAGALRPVRTGEVPVAPGVATPASEVTEGRAVTGLGEQPVDIAIDAGRDRLYTANFVSGDVSVLDTATHEVLNTLDVPGRPIAVAVDPGGRRIFIADHAGRRIYAIDTASGSRKTVGRTGRDPVDLAYDHKRKRLFVANQDDGTVWVYDTAANRRLDSVTTAGQPASLAVDASAGTLYVLTTSLVSTYSTSTLARVGYAKPAMFGRSIAVDTKLRRLYVLSGSTLQETNLITSKTRLIRMEAEAGALCIDPAERVAHLVDPDENRVTKLKLS